MQPTIPSDHETIRIFDPVSISSETEHVSWKSKWFTLVELIVVISILSILGVISFISIWEYSSQARDSARVWDVEQIMKSLDLSVVTSGAYPLPDNAFAVTYSGGVVWNQGTVANGVIQYFRFAVAGGGLNKKPVDPLRNSEYTYSSLAEGKAYQVKVDYENEIANATAYSLLPLASAEAGNPTIAYIRGNYGGLSAKTMTGGMVYVLAIPSIVTNSGTSAWGLLRIENDALSGTLLFNGKPLVNATSYNPNAQAEGGVVYAGTGLPTSDSEREVTAIVDALKAVYETSDLAASANVANLLSASGTTAVSSLGASIVNLQLGGKVTGGPPPPVVYRYPGCDTDDIVLANGQSWAACNVGATKAYSGETLGWCPVLNFSDTDCNLSVRDSIGGFYQWGRNQNVAPKGTPTTALAATGTTANGVGHSEFIQNGSDWIASPNSNLWGGAGTSIGAGTYSDMNTANKSLMKWPCATGYHVPTIKEWCNAAVSITSNASICSGGSKSDTAIASTLKLPLAGMRTWFMSSYASDSFGFYRTSSPYSATQSYVFEVLSTSVTPTLNDSRSPGYSIRCLRN